MQAKVYMIRDYTNCSQGNEFYTKILYVQAEEEQSPDFITLTVTGLGRITHCQMPDFSKTEVEQVQSYMQILLAVSRKNSLVRS
jgi:hypothetical protein